MKRSYSLKQILDVIIFLIALSIITGLIFLILSLIGISTSNISINNISTDSLDWKFYCFTLLIILVYILYLYGLIRLRNGVRYFITSDYYNPKTTQYFDTAGKCFALAALLHWFFTAMGKLVIEREIALSFGERTFIYLFIIAMGLFILLVSAVLTKARLLKEENDLTI